MGKDQPGGSSVTAGGFTATSASTRQLRSLLKLLKAWAASRRSCWIFKMLVSMPRVPPPAKPFCAASQIDMAAALRYFSLSVRFQKVTYAGTAPQTFEGFFQVDA